MVFRQIMKTCQSLRRQNIEDFQVIVNFVANSVYVFISEIYNTSEKLGTHHQKHTKRRNNDFKTNVENVSIITETENWRFSCNWYFFGSQKIYIFKYSVLKHIWTIYQENKEGRIMFFRQNMKTCQSLQRQNIEDFQLIDNFVTISVYMYLSLIFTTHQKYLELTIKCINKEK